MLKYLFALPLLCLALPSCSKRGDHIVAGDLAWTFVDRRNQEGINKDVSVSAGGGHLAVFNDKLYAAWTEDRSVRVAVYNGNDNAPSWNFVDGNAAAGLKLDSSLLALDVRLLVNDSKLYAFWSEQNDALETTSVGFVYNGNDVSPEWKTILNDPLDAGEMYGTFISHNSKIYSAWGDLKFAVYNGNDEAPSWPSLGEIHSGTAFGYSPSFGVFQSRLYATWYSGVDGAGEQTRVAVYNGTDGAPAWALVDGGGTYGLNVDRQKRAFGQRLLAVDGKLYLIWSESTLGVADEQLRAFVYNGDDLAASWTRIDAGLNRGEVYSNAGAMLFSFASQLIAVFTEDLNSFSRVRATRYSVADSTWSFLDGGGDSGISGPDVEGRGGHCVEWNGKMYLAYTQHSTPRQVRILVGAP